MFIFYALWYVGNVYILELEKICEGIKLHIWDLLLITFMEKEMATHSSTLAWKTPWTEEPGGLQSMGSQRVGHD